jgi:hypothetical protein
VQEDRVWEAIRELPVLYTSMVSDSAPWSAAISQRQLKVAFNRPPQDFYHHFAHKARILFPFRQNILALCAKQ